MSPCLFLLVCAGLFVQSSGLLVEDFHRAEDGTLYGYIGTTKSYSAAEEECHKNGGGLVNITKDFFSTKASSLMSFFLSVSQGTRYSYWLGVNNFVQVGGAILFVGGRFGEIQFGKPSDGYCGTLLCVEVEPKGLYCQWGFSDCFTEVSLAIICHLGFSRLQSSRWWNCGVENCTEECFNDLLFNNNRFPLFPWLTLRGGSVSLFNVTQPSTRMTTTQMTTTQMPTTRTPTTPKKTTAYKRRERKRRVQKPKEAKPLVMAQTDEHFYITGLKPVVDKRVSMITVCGRLCRGICRYTNYNPRTGHCRGYAGGELTGKKDTNWQLWEHKPLG